MTFVTKSLKYNSRTENSIPNFSTVRYGKHSIRYFGPYLWSKLPKESRNIASLKTLRSRIRKTNISELAGNSNCHNCYLCLSLFLVLVFLYIAIIVIISTANNNKHVQKLEEARHSRRGEDCLKISFPRFATPRRRWVPSLLHTHTTPQISLGFSPAASYCACPPSGLTLFYYKCNQVYANKHSACWKNSPIIVGRSRNIDETNKQKYNYIKYSNTIPLDGGSEVVPLSVIEKSIEVHYLYLSA